MPVLSEAELDSMRDTVVETMTMTCLVERDGATGGDVDGQPNAPEWETHIAAQECYGWSPSLNRQVEEQGPDKTVRYQTIYLKVPVDADITERDRIHGITNELGESVNANILQIREVRRRPTHTLLICEQQARDSLGGG